MTPDGNGGAVRTEDDLRQALATLDRHAPSVETALAAVRGAAGGSAGRGGRSRIRRWRPRAAHRWWRRPRLILSLAAAATTAGVVITVLQASGPPRPGSRPGQAALPGSAHSEAGLPTAAAMGRAMLTAFNTVRDDIEYSTETGISKGATVDVYRDWSWPAQPVPGQLQHDRTLFSERTPKSPAVILAEDNEISFVTPRAGVTTVRGQITVVCYLGAGAACGYSSTNTPAGMWSQVSGTVLNAPDIGSGGMLSPASLARGIATGQWRIMHRTRLKGQPAIELRETSHGPDVIEPLPTLLWVNARTHLPIRMVNGVGSANVTVNEWAYLSPTPASLALLQVHIPAGYRHYVPKR
jgi:hypothetical protein